MKATAIAPANIAFIKYWGKKDEKLRLPTNGSISFNLSNLTTTTTVEFSRKYSEDEILIDGKKNPEKEARLIKHLNRIRKRAGIINKAKVVSKNNFPMGTGLSSSASGFAALTVAGSVAAGLKLTERELTILARQGSGSACRSIPSGWVEWLEGKNSEASYARSIFPPNWWNIADIVVVLSGKEKETPTSEGQRYYNTSPFFKTRLENINEKIKKMKQYIKNRDFQRCGSLVEAEALELHSIMLTSNPALIYLLPETIKMMKLVKQWRNEGLSVYFSLNTGQNIHLICTKSEINIIKRKLKNISDIKNYIVNYPSKGADLISNHLF